MPDFEIAPNDFSSIVLKPPLILSGVGLTPFKSTPFLIAILAYFSITLVIFCLTFLLLHLFIRLSSPPKHSTGSEKIAEPLLIINLSTKKPSDGLAINPDVVSDPPHSNPKTKSLRLNNFFLIYFLFFLKTS